MGWGEVERGWGEVERGRGEVERGRCDTDREYLYWTGTLPHLHSIISSYNPKLSQLLHPSNFQWMGVKDENINDENKNNNDENNGEIEVRRICMINLISFYDNNN